MFDDFKAGEASQSRGEEVAPGLPPGEEPCVMTGAMTGAKTGDEPDETLDVTPTAGAQCGKATEVNATRASAKEGRDSRLKRPLSKRSGGPRSRDGKAVASGNSLKHGAYSTRPVQLDLYHLKLNGVFDELSPSGVIAKTLCGDVAHGLAKLETINTYERDLIYSAQHHGVSLSELARKLDFPWAQTHLHLLAEPPAQAVLQAQVARSWRTLARPPKSLAGVARGDDLLAPMKPVKGATKLAPCLASEGIEIGNSAGCPSQDGLLRAGPRNRVKPTSKNVSRALVHSDKGELVPMADLRAAWLYETGCDVFARPWLGIWEHEHFLQQVDLVMAEAAQGQCYMGERVMKRGETMFLILYWLLRNLQRLNECVAQLKNERTMGVLLNDKVERARSHVQRGLRESLGSLQVTRELRWGPQE